MQQQTNNIIGAGAGSAGAASQKKITFSEHPTWDDLIDHSKSSTDRFTNILYEYFMEMKPLSLYGGAFSNEEWIDECLRGILSDNDILQSTYSYQSAISISERSIERSEKTLKTIGINRTLFDSYERSRLESSIRNDKVRIAIYSNELNRIYDKYAELVKIYKFDMVKRELIPAILFHPSKVDQIVNLENGFDLLDAYFGCKTNKDALEMFEKIMSCPVK